MSPARSNQARRIAVAAESALYVASGRATVLFAIGPALGEGTGEHRLDRILSALAPELETIRWATQVHGCELAVIRDPVPRGVDNVGNGDALATSLAGVGLVVWTADCVPVVLVGSHGVTIAHAGWRGSAGGIVPATVAALDRELGIDPDDLSAFLGPSISGAHYQVGPEVIDALGDTGIDDARWRAGDHVDLRAFLTAQLESLGVVDVRPVGPCTFTTPEYASFRRDGDVAGRQWSMVYLPKTDEPGRSRS